MCKLLFTAPLVFVILLIEGIAVGMAQTPQYRTFTMRDGLSQMKVSALHFDSRGYLWAGTRNGLNRFNGEEFEVFTVDDGLLNNRILGLQEDSTGALIILTSGGINIYDGSTMRGFPKAFQGVNYRFYFDDDGVIWIDDQRTGAELWTLSDGDYDRIDNGSGRYTFGFDKITRQKFLISSDTVFQLTGSQRTVVSTDHEPVGGANTGDIEGRVIVATHVGQSISRVTENGLLRITTNFPEAVDLIENKSWWYSGSTLNMPYVPGRRLTFTEEFFNVGDIVQDGQGHYWIAADNGLTQLYQPMFGHIPFAQLPNVWTVLEDETGAMWFGTYGNGLYRWASGASIPERVFSQNGWNNFFPSSAIRPDGTLFFSNQEGYLTFEGESFHSHSYGTVFTLHVDPIRNILTTTSLEGVRFQDLNTDELHHLTDIDGMHKNDYIQNLSLDTGGCYWMGSYTGLTRYCLTDGRLTNFVKEDHTLPSTGVFASHITSDHTVWLGGDNGLMYVDATADSIVLITSAVVNQMVKAILELDSSRLLIAAKDGLYLFDYRTFLQSGHQHFQAINVSSGYLGIEPGFNGLFKDSKGQVWITSATSVDVLDPGQIRWDQSQLSAQISRIEGQNIPFDHTTYVHGLNKKASTTTIQFDAIGMQRPSTTKYQYRFDNGSWSEWTTENQVTLTDLSQGSHTFAIRAGPTDLPPDDEFVDKIEFEVDLAYYQRSFFPPLALALGILLLGSTLFYFYQQRHARRRFAAQLEESRYLRSQLLLAELNPHFIFNVLASIQNKIITGQKEAASRYVVKLSKLMRNFLNASYKGNERGNFEQDIPLSQEIDLLTSFIEFEQDKSDDHFDFEIIEDLETEAAAITIPPMILQPYVENAIKHGLLLNPQRGHLAVSFSQTNGALTCHIMDNGVGRRRSRELRAKAFKMHKSLGSKIVEERIALLNELGYDISVVTEDNIPTGTVVTVEIRE